MLSIIILGILGILFNILYPFDATAISDIFSNELYYIEIKILVKDLETLTIFINDIESLPEVIDVERVIRWR